MTEREAAALTIEQTLAWFREPRYSVSDLQRAYGEGHTAALNAGLRLVDEVIFDLPIGDDVTYSRGYSAGVAAARESLRDALRDALSTPTPEP